MKRMLRFGCGFMRGQRARDLDHGHRPAAVIVGAVEDAARSLPQMIVMGREQYVLIPQRRVGPRRSFAATLRSVTGFTTGCVRCTVLSSRLCRSED